MIITKLGSHGPNVIIKSAKNLNNQKAPTFFADMIMRIIMTPGNGLSLVSSEWAVQWAWRVITPSQA